MGDGPVLKTDPKIVHHRIVRKRVEIAPAGRGPGTVFIDFSDISDKNGHFPGSIRVLLAKLAILAENG